MRVNRSILLVFGMVLAACGNGSGGATTLETTATTAAPITTTTTGAPTTTTTAAPSTTTTAAPTTTMAAPAPVAPDPGLAGAVPFTDPEGDYTIWVDSTWVEAHGALVAGMELWSLPNGVTVTPDGQPFGANLNLLSQAIPADIDLEAYLALSIEGAPALVENFELIRSEIVDGATQPLAIMEYRAISSGIDASFFAVFGLRPERAVIATFTALPEQYDELLTEVEPYMLTLVPTP